MKKDNECESVRGVRERREREVNTIKRGSREGRDVLDALTVPLGSVYDGEELPPLHELQQHVQLPLVLEGGVEAEDEGVVAAQHHVLLVQHVVLLLVRDYFRLKHCFQGVEFLRTAVLHQRDATECPRS